MSNCIKAVRPLSCLLMLFCTMSSCQETWQERTAREMREMTERQCPFYLTDVLIVDSLVFNVVQNARHSYYTLLGNQLEFAPEIKYRVHSTLVDEVRGSLDVATLKQHNCTFFYHYRSQGDGRLLYTDSVTASEYATGSKN